MDSVLLKHEHKYAKSYIVLSWVGTVGGSVCFHISKNLVSDLGKC